MSCDWEMVAVDVQSVVKSRLARRSRVQERESAY